MMVGGIVIAGAYLLKLRGEEQSGRPPIVARLKENFLGRDQNNKVFEMAQLEGRVCLIAPIAGKEKERIAETLRVMKMVAEKYPEDRDLRFVGVTVDPENDGPEELKALLRDLGVAEDPRWLLVQAEEDSARNYLKEQLRLDTTEVIMVDGDRINRFLSLMAVVDPYLHLRQHYNFNQAREVQEDARRLLEEDPAEAERLRAADHTDDLKAAEEHLIRTLDYLRKEELGAGKKS